MVFVYVVFVRLFKYTLSSLADLLSDEEVHRPKVSELTQSSPDPITTSGSWQQDPLKSTMWLGTEDGW